MNRYPSTQLPLGGLAVNQQATRRSVLPEEMADLVADPKVQEHFWLKVSKRGPNDCWEWTGCKIKQGYGRLRIKGSLFLAHRCSYLIHVGDIPKGSYICHTCDNPACVNPVHLWPGTSKDNKHDCIEKRRHVRGTRVWSAKLDYDKAHIIRELYASGEWSMKQLSEEFGVYPSVIFGIVHNRIWKGPCK